MRFYRIELTTFEDSSLGFRYATTRHAAARIATEQKREGVDATIDAIEVAPTKAGILAALERYASHPDNG